MLASTATLVSLLGAAAPASAASIISITDTASCTAAGGTNVVLGCRFYTPLDVPAGTVLESTIEIQTCRDSVIDGEIHLADGVGLGVFCGTFTNNGTITMSNATVTVFNGQASLVNNGAIEGCNLSVDGTISGNALTDTCPDTAAPTSTISVPDPDGDNGWLVTDPTVSISATDGSGGSGVASTRCVLDPASVPTTYADLPATACPYLGAGASVTAEGAHTIYAASIDNDANAETPVNASFKIDTVAPSLAPAPDSIPYLNGSGVTASPHAADGGSGLASSSCEPMDTSSAGARSVSCSATDLAGNTSTTTLHYTVWYRLTGFLTPATGSKWKVGQAVPVKLVLSDANGVRIPDASAAALAASCAVRFSATGAQTQGPSCMKYDSTSHQFLFSWKLAKSPSGAATIRATVAYGAGTTSNTLTASIVITR